jgi:pimeloyl-ACP methyl ester carboxylesterase
MPIFEYDSAGIHYEEFGSGFPVVIFAPGGLRSELAYWHSSPSNPAAAPPWMNPMTELATRYRVIAMDQRNAGRSRGAVAADHGWHTYAADHLALMDHLGIARAHVMGGCIGASFCLKLCEMAPQRIAAAVLQNPIGHADNRAVFANLVKTWAEGMRNAGRAIDDATLASFAHNMFGGDFVFSVGRDFVRRCATPLLVMPGDDAPHPNAIGEEIAALAPDCEVLRAWKGPAHLQDAIARVGAFLARHTPGPDTRQAA